MERPKARQSILLKFTYANTWLRLVAGAGFEPATFRFFQRMTLRLTWDNISLERQLAYLPLTKNGTSREVPLSIKAVQVLNNQRSRQDTPTPFPVNTNAFRLAWERLRKRADLCDLRFHDLRHEAISRFFEMGLSIPEVAVISGHKDARMLFRYTHLRAEDLVKKIN